MPIYTYACKCCGKASTSIRSIKEEERDPTKEEQSCECDQPEWEKKLYAPVNRYRFAD